MTCERTLIFAQFTLWIAPQNLQFTLWNSRLWDDFKRFSQYPKCSPPQMEVIYFSSSLRPSTPNNKELTPWLGWFFICCVVVNRRSHRYASFLRLAHETIIRRQCIRNLLFDVLVHYILLAIHHTLFFLPAFPFSDYCLKRRKVQSATDRPKKS